MRHRHESVGPTVVGQVPAPLASTRKPVADEDDDWKVIDPPGSMEVDFERRPVLWLPDGRALVRRAGF
jgi:hypothetical protein